MSAALSSRLPVMDTIKTAWRKVYGVKATFWSILSIVFTLEVMMAFLKAIFQSPTGDLPLPLKILAVLVAVIVLFFSWDMLFMGIEWAAGRAISFKQVRYALQASLFVRMAGLYLLEFIILCCVAIPLMIASILVDMHLVISMVLCLVWVVMLLFVATRLYLAKAIVIAGRKDPITALKISFRATRGYALSILWIIIMTLLILVVSAVPLGIGLIWSLPFLFVTYGEVYRRLIS
jgi:hypothetical protein